MIKIIKRTEYAKGYVAFVRISAVILALITTAILILFIDKNPILVYFSMIKGCFGSVYRFRETIIKTIPLVITSLGISVAFKMKFWNIGAEGQMFMGAFLASFVALFLSGLNKPLMLLLMVLAGIIGGGLWAIIPAFFKAYFKTNETLLTLMLNYIALKWIYYLQYSLWKDPKAFGFPKIANFQEAAILPKLFGIHIGWIFAIVLIVIYYIFFKYSKKGYEISVVGESENTAKYAGMNVVSIILTSIFISGGMCGLSGMLQASGVAHSLSTEITGGVGYTAIITSWLGNLSAPLIAVSSFLFAILLQGGAYIQTAYQIPQAAAEILQGMILFFVLGSEFFINYKIVLKRGELT